MQDRKAFISYSTVLLKGIRSDIHIMFPLEAANARSLLDTAYMYISSSE